ncbi:MAG: type VI secretion system accessory protein TagJ [Acetobacteraceae bacterium]
MDARESLRSGDSTGALEQLKQEVRKAPRDPRLRTFLFQMFCIFGEWDRALTQLATIAELDPIALPMTQAYQAAIRCEILRGKVFAGSRTPTFFGEPESWMSLLVEAGRVLAAGRPEEAAGLRDAAFEGAPTAAGSLQTEAGEQEFAWIADADQRLGPVLEAIIDGKYYFVPFHRIGRIDIEAPADLRDQVWLPAHFTWANQGETVGFIPTRYPGSEAAGGEIALGRRTEWRESGDWFLGIGQRMLATDAGETALMDVRRITFAGLESSEAGPPTTA